MNPHNWYDHGVMATEESTVFTAHDQQLWEIWTVEVLDSGTAVPKRLGSQLGNDFAGAVTDWVESTVMEEHFDPLTMSFNGMPLVSSREEAMALVQRRRAAQ